MDWQESSCIHTNREMIVKRAMASDATHFLFIDDDMTFQPWILDLLFSRYQPVVVVNYLIKNDDLAFVAVGLDGKRVPTREKDTGIVPIAYSGFGVSLFEMDVWRKTPQPWFLPKFNAEDSSYTTEDAPCFERIREAGFPVYLDHDASKLVGHVGLKEWSWREWKPKEQ
jgi:hypothetical protein